MILMEKRHLQRKETKMGRALNTQIERKDKLKWTHKNSSRLEGKVYITRQVKCPQLMTAVVNL